MAPAFGQRVDAVAQSQQRSVDVVALAEALARVARGAAALRTGQVDQ